MVGDRSETGLVYCPAIDLLDANFENGAGLAYACAQIESIFYDDARALRGVAERVALEVATIHRLVVYFGQTSFLGCNVVEVVLLLMGLHLVLIEVFGSFLEIISKVSISVELRSKILEGGLEISICSCGWRLIVRCCNEVSPFRFGNSSKALGHFVESGRSIDIALLEEHLEVIIYIVDEQFIAVCRWSIILRHRYR